MEKDFVEAQVLVAQRPKGAKSIAQGNALRKLPHPVHQAESLKSKRLRPFRALDRGVRHHVGRCPTLLITRLSALVRGCATDTCGKGKNNPVRDYLSVENENPARFRIPLGMHPVGMQRIWRRNIFLPREPSLRDGGQLIPSIAIHTCNNSINQSFIIHNCLCFTT